MENLKNPWGKLWTLLLKLALFSGVLYLTAQLLINKEIKDSIFIGLLCGSTIIAYQVSINIFNKIKNTPSLLGGAKKTEDTLKLIFSIKFGFTIAIPFASIFAIVTYVVSPWNDQDLLNWMLLLFIVSCNIITGFALSAILSYYNFALKIGKKIKVELWNRSDPTLIFLMEINGILSKSVALVSAFGVSATMFSVFQINAPVYLFTIFSALVVASTFVIPTLPITNKIRVMKKDHLLQLSKLIQKEYDHIIQVDNTCTQKSSDRFEDLIKASKHVSTVRAFPPVAQRTLNSAAYVTLVTMLPATIDLLLKTIGTL